MAKLHKQARQQAQQRLFLHGNEQNNTTQAYGIILFVAEIKINHYHFEPPIPFDDALEIVKGGTTIRREETGEAIFLEDGTARVRSISPLRTYTKTDSPVVIMSNGIPYGLFVHGSIPEASLYEDVQPADEAHEAHKEVHAIPWNSEDPVQRTKVARRRQVVYNERPNARIFFGKKILQPDGTDREDVFVSDWFEARFSEGDTDVIDTAPVSGDRVLQPA